MSCLQPTELLSTHAEQIAVLRATEASDVLPVTAFMAGSCNSQLNRRNWLCRRTAEFASNPNSSAFCRIVIFVHLGT